MSATYAVIVFDHRLRDWTTLKDGFTTQQLAQEYADQYPRWGAEHSRSVRGGNIQITPPQESST